MARSIWPWSTATSTTQCATFAATSATRSLPSFSSTTARENSATWPAKSAAGSRNPKSGAGWLIADFDRDGDLDLLITTNNGPAYLYRNDQICRKPEHPLRLVGTKSNRDAIGASVRIFDGEASQVAPGERRIELPVAVRTSRDFWSRESGKELIVW